MVRVDAFRVNTTAPPGLIDWNAINAQNLPTPDQDLNFDGDLTDVLNPFDDWAKLELNQIGSRRSPGGYFYLYNKDGSVGVLGVGPLSIGERTGDLGPGDLSGIALGRQGDLGRQG